MKNDGCTIGDRMPQLTARPRVQEGQWQCAVPHLSALAWAGGQSATDRMTDVLPSSFTWAEKVQT